LRDKRGKGGTELDKIRIKKDRKGTKPESAEKPQKKFFGWAVKKMRRLNISLLEMRVQYAKYFRD
jgi:hypothetical protein